ncbi:hypothetical protein ACFQ3R_08875 [Mesonia ostreae]|uniref:CarboxypepD_reg-like domain-containing protein n=1 Tax=Mesonia ostreae TaxID=861110 RepID=A0ABU2KEU1_9FLAO|nr:hypothetical protein [Mesonia ostreae]MDT0293219.1 hypothetical protein [Mesonia ostreae]
MKKELLLLIFLLNLSFIQAQIENRVFIKGQVSVDSYMDAGDINIYNMNTTEGVSTNKYGEFIIKVGLNDRLMVSSIQYQKFIVTIDAGVLKNKTINIKISEAVNELEEITLKPYDLSGNVQADVAKITTVNVDRTKLSSEEMVNTYAYKFRDDKDSKVENIAMDKGYLTNGLNFANIFRTIFNSNTKERKLTAEDMDVSVRKVYNDDFFKRNLDVKKENINEFIFYAQENGLEERMLEKGNELDLIEFLIEKSKAYKMQQQEN